MKTSSIQQGTKGQDNTTNIELVDENNKTIGYASLTLLDQKYHTRFINLVKIMCKK